MSLQDFLSGTQALQSGVDSFAKDAAELRKQSDAKEYADQVPALMSKFRTSTDPSERAQIAGTVNNLAMKAGQDKSPFIESMAKSLYPPASAVAPLTQDNLGTAYSYIPQETQSAIAKLPAAQQKDAIANWQKQNSLESRNTRQEKSQSFQAGQKAISSAEQFGDKFATVQKGYDEAVGSLDAQRKVFQNNPTKQSAFELSERMVRASGGGSAISDSKLGQMEFQDLNSKWVNLRNEIANLPEGQLPPEIIKAYNDLSQNTLNATKEKRADILSNQLGTMASAHSDRLIGKNGELHPVVKTIANGLGVNVKKTENGIEVSKNAGQHSGDNANLVNMAATIKDTNAKSQYIKYLNDNSNRSFTPTEIDHLKKKMQQSGATGG